MTSIFSGQLYRNLVKDQNSLRLENYDVNRFQKTVQQQTNQSQREKNLREGLEFHQAIMADLQTKLNEVTEKLNNLYRRFIENNAAFRKVTTEPNYYDTSQVLNTLRSVTDLTPPNDTNYPAGVADIVPFDDPGRVKNYSYNPYFGSKAIDQSDTNVVRTYYQEEGRTDEEAYRENGAFWSTVGYLWGWDIDRVNATYATTNKFLPVTGTSILTLSSTAGLAVGDNVTFDINGSPVVAAVTQISGSNVTLSSALPSLPPSGTAITWDNGTGSGTITGATSENYNNLQVNVVAVQPNREPSPPMRPGDRFPLTSGQYPSQTIKPFPSISIDGIRPGGADYNHAQFTTTANEIGQDSLNWGWEFDDLPLALEVTSVRTNSDGSVQADGFKIVYDIRGNIPPSHSEYDRLLTLDGTEPLILDAPTDMTKVRINNNSFAYSGLTELGDRPRFTADYETPFDGFGGTGRRTSTNVSPHPGNLIFERVANLDFSTCTTVAVAAGMRLSFDYNFIMQQNAQTGDYASPGDDGYVPPYSAHNWSNDPVTWPDVIGSLQYNFSQVLNTPVSVGGAGGPFAGKLIMELGRHPTAVGVDPFHSAGGYTPGAAFMGISGSNLGNGGTGLGPVRLNSTTGSLNIGDTVEINGATRTITNIQGLNIYLNSPLPSTPAGGTQVLKMPGSIVIDTVHGSNTGRGEAGLLEVDDAAVFAVGNSVTVYNQPTPTGGETVYGVATITSVDTTNNLIGLSPPLTASGQPVVPTVGRVQINSTGAGTTGAPNESVTLVFEQNGTTGMRVGVYVDGDIHHFEIEVKNLKVVSYGPPNPGGWDQGLYVADDIALGNGAPPVNTDPAHVVNKYETDNYNFTQFFNEYDNPATIGGGVDLNDIVRSPYEFGMLNIGRNSLGQDSNLNGEMWIDLNDRRLNLGGDLVHDGTQLEDFDSQADWNTSAQTYNTNYFSGANVQEAYRFVAPDDPEDDCIPGTAGGAGTRFGEVADSDPWTTTPLVDVSLSGGGNISALPLDPMRADTSLNFGAASYFVDDNTGNSLLGATENDANGTADRVAGTDVMKYTVAIPTTDLNILRKENDLVFNFGSVANRNYGITVNEPFMEYRTVSDYQTVPRYRVDSSGNIYDRFGYGYYNPANPDDQAVLDDLYPTVQIGAATTTVPLINGQVSNHDGAYNNGASYNADGDWTNTVQDRMSYEGDDYNLFDFVPDLEDDPNNPDPDVLRGERYVGSLPTNFYYYRESLDNGAGGLSVPTNSDDGVTANFTNDNKPTLNFDGRYSNIDGQFNDATTNASRTYVHNTEMPGFANVIMGYTEQKAVLANAQSETTFVTWKGFPGLGGETLSAKVLIHPNPNDGTVINPLDILGKSRESAAEILTGEDITVEMFADSSLAGHLLVYETFPSPTIPPQKLVANVIANPTGVGAPYGNGNGQPVYLDNVNLYDVGDVIYFDRNNDGNLVRKVVTNIVNTGPGNNGYIEFTNNSPNMGDNNPVEAPIDSGSFTKLIPFMETAAHAIPLPLEPGYDFTFESYATRRTMVRTGSEVRGGVTYLHVDSGTIFQNPPPAIMDIVIGPPPGGGATQTFTITPADVDTSTHPHIIRIPGVVSAGNMLTDTPITMTAGEFTVSIGDGALDNSQITIEYNDLGTDLPGLIASVELSPEMDRVGRTIGDDVRTDDDAGNNEIAPEYFDDQPRGYIQPDGRVDLSLISRDTDGNQVPRRLKEVRITIDSGEQVILGNYEQAITSAAAGPALPAPGSTIITLPSVANYQVGGLIQIGGQQATITAKNAGAGTLTVSPPLATLPAAGDNLVRLPSGKITQEYSTNDLDSTIGTTEGALLSNTGTWPIALFDEQFNPLNPEPTDDLGILVGYYQGITACSTTTSTNDTVTITNAASEFKMGDIVTVNGEQRTILSVTADEIVLDQGLTNPPKYGDTISLGRGNGMRDIQAYINRSFAMSTNAPIKVDMIWQEYDITGYPPTVSLRAASENDESVGFSTTDPGQAPPATAYKGANHVIVGDGRSGGATDNEFTVELKRILDNPEYAEVFRHDLFKNIFITASVSDPFNDLISSKMMLTYEREKRRVELLQTSYMAYYKRI